MSKAKQSALHQLVGAPLGRVGDQVQAKPPADPPAASAPDKGEVQEGMRGNPPDPGAVKLDVRVPKASSARRKRR